MSRTLSTLIALTILLGGGLAIAARPSPAPANVGQVDVFGTTLETGWTCPTPTGTTGTFYEVPDLRLSLTTGGGPVLVMVQFNFYGPTPSPGSAFWFEPLIDEVPQSADRQSWQTGGAGSSIELFSYHRVYALQAGTHTFAARMSCQSTVVVFRGWMTVYELPPQGTR
jgi:hypothetical protein